MKTWLSRIALLVWLPCLLVVTALAQNTPIKLEVDAANAKRNVLNARMHVPVKPGKLTLLYPQWLPGVHGPEGPINDLVALKITADGKPVNWIRDAENMFAFHLTVPNGADELEVNYSFMLPFGGQYSSGVSSTAKLLVLSWNHIVLYPEWPDALNIKYDVTLKLPEDWKSGGSMPVARSRGDEVRYSTVTLETLVDSPVIAGEFFRTVELAPEIKPPHKLHIVADSAAALEIKEADIERFSRLVREANALFGSHPYKDYHFLLTLSDHVAHFGLEHHSSSDNRRVEKFLIDEDSRKSGAGLLPHELVHSWCGKYRRPAGMATPDFEKPMHGELLWVYEGLTTYLGNVLTVRSGLGTNTDYYSDMALIAASLDRQPGRQWRPLADTTIGAQLVYNSKTEGSSWRRRTDFYPEGSLIWLEADTIIRRESGGKRSLDDFCKKFFGGYNGAPKVVSYTLDDVISDLNAIHPYKWREFFQKRIYEVAPRAPLGGIENAGWQVTYTNKVPAALKSRENSRKFTDMTHSLGFSVQQDGTISDVLPGSPAEKSGIGPTMKLVAVNGRKWTGEILRRTVSATATNRESIELLVESDDYFKTHEIKYRDGEKYPILERDSSKPDMLVEILKPVAR
jgi:predicted metalloprotease with PDZ domain